MRAVICIFLLCVGIGVHAQSRASPEALGDVLADVDGDRIPDRLGEAVSIAGRAAMDAGALGDARSTSLVSGTRGIWIRSPEALGVRAGDSLIVSGRLGFSNGLAVLDSAWVERASGETRMPSPIWTDSGDLEQLESQMIEIVGQVVSTSDAANGGQAMMLVLDDKSLVTAFAYADNPTGLTFEEYEVGDRLHVTGLAGQFDAVAPYDGTYQIYPQTSADIKRGGLSQRLYRWLAAGAIAMLLAALIWAILLRGEVRRQVSELRRSEAHYRTLVRNASDAVFVYDIEGNGVEVNPAARAAFGLGPLDPAPGLYDVVSDRDRARAHLILLRANGSDRCDLSLSARGPKDAASGAERVYEFESHVMEIGHKHHVLSLARDVGARRAYEAELVEARREAEEMVRLKSAFLASMSHEIRTPLTAVIGFAEILSEEVEGEHQELAGIIEDGGRRLLRTLNSVLDLARLDAGTEALTPLPLDLVASVQESVTLLRSLAEEKGLTLSFESTTETLPALADAGALDRVVSNLVGNAIKFTSTGGVRASLSASGDEAVLTITDTGMGIDKSFLPNLFSEFRQESEGYARSHEGTGLGLAISNRLVEMMEGSIAVESEKGVGTAFTIRLPRIAGTPPPAGAFTPEAARVVASAGA